MRRILLVFMFGLSVSGCAGNMWRYADTSTHSKSLAPNSKDLLAQRGQEDDGTKPGYFHSFNHNRLEEFVEKAEEKKSEVLQTNSGEQITLKYTKTYVSAGNHLCKLFRLSKSVKTENQQVFANVFCRANNRWQLLVPLSHRDGQWQLYNALKDTLPRQETS